MLCFFVDEKYARETGGPNGVKKCFVCGSFIFELILMVLLSMFLIKWFFSLDSWWNFLRTVFQSDLNFWDKRDLMDSKGTNAQNDYFLF